MREEDEEKDEDEAEGNLSSPSPSRVISIVKRRKRDLVEAKAEDA